MLRTRRSRKVTNPIDTSRISGTNTTEAYRASKALLVRNPPAMAAPSVPTTATASGRPRGRVRMSTSMWRRLAAAPNSPNPARAKNIRARARPWLVLPPANDDTAFTMAAKLAGVAQGVPVCRDWKKKVGSQGTKVRQPTTAAANEARAPLLHSGRPRQPCQANHTKVVPMRYSDQ